MPYRDRIEPTLLAGALGDAVGARYEGGVAAPFEIAAPLALTDDTQMTIATCEGLVEATTVDPARIASRFAVWFRERRIRGIGASTYKALNELMHGGHWALVGARGERAAGNGAAMRIAPLAFCLDPFSSDDRRTIRDVCRITHHKDEAYVGALAVLIAMRTGNNEADRLREVAAHLPDTAVRDRLLAIADSGLTAVADVASRFGSSGYVVDSVPLAIFASVGAGPKLLDRFREICEAGGDTDTICSMTGHIVGFRHGNDALDRRSVDLIPERELLVTTAEALARALDF